MIASIANVVGLALVVLGVVGAALTVVIGAPVLFILSRREWAQKWRWVRGDTLSLITTVGLFMTISFVGVLILLVLSWFD